jgi:hypothetical protein
VAVVEIAIAAAVERSASEMAAVTEMAAATHAAEMATANAAAMTAAHAHAATPASPTATAASGESVMGEADTAKRKDRGDGGNFD